MRRCNLKQFRRLFYAPGSEPAVSTLRSKIRRKRLAGGFVDEDGRYWVDLDEHDRANNVTATLDAQRSKLLKAPELEGLV